jgi:hypothetical protein
MTCLDQIHTFLPFTHTFLGSQGIVQVKLSNPSHGTHCEDNPSAEHTGY